MKIFLLKGLLAILVIIFVSVEVGGTAADEHCPVGKTIIESKFMMISTQCNCTEPGGPIQCCTVRVRRDPKRFSEIESCVVLVKEQIQ